MQPDLLPSRPDTTQIRVARAVLTRLLPRLRGGELQLVEEGTVHTFGRPTADGLVATASVVDPATYAAVLRRGSIGLGEAYAEGWWTSEDPAAVVRLLARNIEWIGRLHATVDRATGAASGRRRADRPQDLRRDRADIAAHYDLGNDFFALFLDPTMAYSCAVFTDPEMTLEEASVAKFEQLCELADIRPEHEVLEIGTGWGGFALHAADRLGCHVTTTTISREQYDHARKRVADAGLDGRVEVLDRDYRQLHGSFDRLVTIEMIEAVDWREYDTFFETCARRLRPGGQLAMQAITMPHDRHLHRRDRVDFIKAHIFPGGCIPSIEALDAAAARAGFRLVRSEDIGEHYVETLRRWRQTLLEQEPALERLGLDQRFRRLWEFYLAFCEAGFAERHVSDHHLIWQLG